ncbi:cytochrome c oxidase subunit I [Rhabdothermincola sp.]|uniref:cytochrome c oxidase subunit I n=1 Tax=Rhabdothermincola sp. TaxID=2820405 RepID=UPI002FE294A9
MTVLDDRPPVTPEPVPPEAHGHPTGLLRWFTSTDHKDIGLAYMVTAFGFFLVGGVLALGIRAQLAQPEQQILSTDTYNQFFTMHGSIMLFLFAGPFAFGLANYLVPIQAGARDMALPRLNLFSYWVYLAGGLTMLSSFLTSNGAPSFGWFAYTPLSDGVRSPGVGGDLWIAGVALTGLSGILTAVNILTTVATMRAPGMTMFRLPIFTWNMIVTSILVLIAFPALTAAVVMLFADRYFGGHIFDAANGGMPILWQHLFWFFGHPEVYILVLPFFGVVTEIFPVFARRPVFGYRGLVFATMAIGALSIGVWAHHMYATGAVLLPFFAALTMLIAVPTGVKFFNWIGTMWGGELVFATPLLFAIGFLVTFVMGGVTGVMLSSPSLDFHLHDSYFVVAHFHYVLFGGSVFALFAGVYYWFPKFTGRMLHEGWGHVHFWMMFVGFQLTFFVQHILGLEGMPRRVWSYLESDGFTTLNLISSIGSGILGASTLVFLWNVWITARKGKPAGADPWGGHTLEWCTPSPPPPGNFVEALPPIRSERPLWDLNHPQHRSPREHGRPTDQPTGWVR